MRPSPPPASRPHRLALLVALLLFLTGCSALAGLASPTPTPLPPARAAQALTPAPTVTPTATVEPLVGSLVVPAAPASPTPSFPWLTGEVRVFPGPRHFVGDLITVEVAGYNLNQLTNGAEPTLSVRDMVLPGDPFVAESPLRADALVFRWVWDTTGWEPGEYRMAVAFPTQSSSSQRIDFLIRLEPSDRRPLQEEQATWAERRTRFSRLYYLTNTAAARDIETLATEVDAAFTDVADRLRVIIPGQPVPVTFIDNVWGNGAYTGDGLVISYTDRLYTTPDVGRVLRHEIVHWTMRPKGTPQTPLVLSEGLAVVVAGGHYKPESIPERAAALLTLDLYIPLTDLADHFWEHQHEVAYLESAGLVTYLVERYGLDLFLDLYGSKGITANTPSGWLDAVFQRTYGVTLAQVESGYLDWLAAREPGPQITDFRLTMLLYDTIRRYQALYAPYQESLPPVEEAMAKGQVSEFIREPSANFNLGIETALIAAQQALLDHDYPEAERVLMALNTSFADGDFSREPVADYLAIAERVAEVGSQAQRTALSDSRATVIASGAPPRLETFNLVFDGEAWQVVD